MNNNYRPATIDERFFEHAKSVNVPINIPELKVPTAASVDTKPIISDIKNSGQKNPKTFSKEVIFVKKNWGYILAGVILISGCWYWSTQKQKEKIKTQNL